MTPFDNRQSLAPYEALRAGMVELQLRQRGIRDQRVLEAMRRVPRHEFVPAGMLHEAYEDHPVPIGEGQTISQPYIVAAMLEAAAIQQEEKVLEVGAGSGYQAALMAELAASVYAIERHESLVSQARRTLEKLGYRNVTLLVGDGTQGLAFAAPFHVILVSAAAPHVPQPLFAQLAEAGRLVVPVGTPIEQELQLVRKINGRPAVSHLDGCRFVPLIGSEGFGSGW